MVQLMLDFQLMTRPASPVLMNSPGFMYESVIMLLPIVCLWKINVVIIIIIIIK
jgi:hypothetical protein